MQNLNFLQYWIKEQENTILKNVNTHNETMAQRADQKIIQCYSKLKQDKNTCLFHTAFSPKRWISKFESQIYMHLSLFQCIDSKFLRELFWQMRPFLIFLSEATFQMLCLRFYKCSQCGTYISPMWENREIFKFLENILRQHLVLAGGIVDEIFFSH